MTDQFRLDGKIAIVTGGIGILGRKFCLGLAQAGASVVVADLDGAACAALALEIENSLGTRSLGVSCDVTNKNSVDNLVLETTRTFGAIDILHNNAASKGNSLDRFFDPFETFDLATWREIMAVNLDGMFLVAQAVGRQMIAQGRGGSIIQTASIYGVLAPDQRIYEGSNYLGRQINTPAVYAASKAAVVGLTRYLATYWANQRIRVNTLVPGGVESGQNEIFRSRYSQRVPLGRMADASEMVGALLFLASDASSYVTGQSLIVDGGLSVW